jgi:hypothetical protein
MLVSKHILSPSPQYNIKLHQLPQETHIKQIENGTLRNRNELLRRNWFDQYGVPGKFHHTSLCSLGQRK